MSIEWKWTPNISLGPILIGSNINSYLKKFQLVKDQSVDATGWETYMLPSFDTYIETEEGKVVSITAHKEFIYKEYNLIGLNLIKLGELLGVSADEVGMPVEYEDGEIRTPYEYSDLGLQVWITNKHVSSISCCTYD